MIINIKFWQNALVIAIGLQGLVAWYKMYNNDFKFACAMAGLIIIEQSFILALEKFKHISEDEGSNNGK